jgi:hypothetical protein
MQSDFQGFRVPFVKDGFKASAGGTNEEITFGPVPSGHLWVINWFGLENETTAFTSLRVYIGGLGQPHYLVEDVSLLADRLYWHEGPLYIGEGRTLVFRFVGTTASDVLRAYAHGFDVIQPEGGPHA